MQSTETAIRSAPVILVGEPGANADLTTWQVAPEDERKFAVWMDCMFKWLASLEARSKRQETSRAYRRDVSDFFATFSLENMMFWEVNKVRVHAWIESMRNRCLSDATINRRLAALSSLYTFASEEYTVITPTGEQGLWPHRNPFKGRSLRARVDPYSRATYMSTEEFQALIRQIDLTTVTGWRNMAIIYGLFATTRRVSEWLQLKWGDIHEGVDGGRWFSYRYKGGKVKKQAIPAALWDIIQRYIDASDRQLADDDYLFVATDDAARHLRGAYDHTAQAISSSYVNKLLKRYGLPCGIAPDRLHAHALRHCGARFRKDHGATVLDLKDILGHAGIAITQVYFDEVLETPIDSFSSVVGEVLPQQLRFSLAGH